VKLETGNLRLGTGGSRSGVALIITLTVMALLLIMAVAFMTNMRSERQISHNYRRQVLARQAALAGLDTAIAKMSKFYMDAEAVNGSIATMAGRFYYTNGNSSANVNVPGAGSRTAYTTNNMLMFSWIKGKLFTPGATNWADKVNINGGNYKWPPNSTQSGIFLPLANPSVNPSRAGASGTSWGPDKPAIWAGYMSLSVGKFAFWVDDESSKINISNAGTRDLTVLGTNNTCVFSTVGAVTTPLPYATVVQSPNKQFSSVDIKALDTQVITGSGGYAPDGRNWYSPATLGSIESARNSGTWQPFQTPDEVLSLDSALTMNDYQAVKSCLTAWSVENDDRMQIYMSNKLASARFNIGRTINTSQQARDLYNFMVDTAKCDLKNSASAKRFFNNATFANKYTGGTNGSVEQIAANIVSYISDPMLVAPIGSKLETPGQPQSTYDPATQTGLPSGACGLWKAAYMNEIAVSLCWQPIQPPAPAAKRWQLWAAICFELINPYDVALPSASLNQRYDFYFDGPVGVTCTLAPPSTPSSLTHNWATNGIAVTSASSIPPHSYSSPDSPGSGVNYFQWTVGAQVITNNAPPITSINITLPVIRQAMDCAANRGIIDWFRATNFTVNAVPAQSAVVGQLTGNPPPNPADFWGAHNPARWSMAKNDPRVHIWYGPPFTGNLITLKNYPGGATGQNPTTGITPLPSGVVSGPAVDFRGGDTETYNGTYAPRANQAEYRSNFAIAEGGMRSLGELGFIHTGRPWRSLSLQYYGAQADERVSGHDVMGKSTRSMPDWAILDLFSVNSTPIYGRVNINNSGWHLGNTGWGPYQRDYPRAATFEDRQNFPNHPNLLAVWSGAAVSFLTSQNYYWSYYTTRTSAYSGYAINPVVVPSNKNVTDTVSVPLAAALNVIPDYRYRNKLANYICYNYHPINTTRTTYAPQGDPGDASFNPTSDIWNPYYTVGQICELPCMNYLFTGDGTQVAYTDADKEDTLRRIINVLTTRGDAFAVHAIGNADGGEARLMAVVERSRDPLASQVIDRNKFSIRQVRWISD
jgi:hypothetical protein